MWGEPRPELLLSKSVFLADRGSIRNRLDEKIREPDVTKMDLIPKQLVGLHADNSNIMG